MNSAITIISEIGTDMTQFSDAKRLWCLLGLIFYLRTVVRSHAACRAKAE